MSEDATTPPWYPVGDDARRTAVVGLGTVFGFAPLFVVFTDWTWLIEGAGAVLCVLAPAVLLRLRSIPRVWHLLPGLAILVVYTTALYLSPAAIGGLIPGPDTWRAIVDLHATAADQVRNSTSPLPSTPALRAFVVPGLGVFAMLIDWYAVVRRAPALAGVPLLALFTVCGAIAGETVGWLPFVFAAAGFLVILSADSRLNLLSWGRIVPRRHGDHPARARLGLSGNRIAVLAVIAAVAIPAVIPGLSRNLLVEAFHRDGNGTGTGNGSGNGSGTSISAFASLKGQLTLGKPITLADVQVNPGTDPYFLRSKVLERYTASGWVAAGSFSGVPVSPDVLAQAAPKGGTTTNYSARITVRGLRDVAPTFGVPQSFDGLRGSWRFNTADATLGAAQTRSGETYTEAVVAPTPSPAQLSGSGQPSGVPDVLTDSIAVPTQVRTLVAGLTNNVSTPYAKAAALYGFFKDPANGFVYSLQTKAGDSGDDLIDFLNNKTGYCQQYAAALAAMFRVAGIPSRVVLGYTHSQPDSAGKFTITSRDAHAWVEGYFVGFGWLPFNPTPLVGADAGRNADEPYDPTATTTTTTAAPTTASGSANTLDPNNRGGINTNSASAAPAPLADSTTASALPSWVVSAISAVGAAILLLLVLPALRLLQRRRRLRIALSSGRIETLWAELRAGAQDGGVDWPVSATPRQIPDWLARHGVDTTEAVRALADGVDRERYAPPGSAGQSAGYVNDSIARLNTVNRAMRARLGRRARLRATLFPPSLISGWRSRVNDETSQGHEAIEPMVRS